MTYTYLTTDELVLIEFYHKISKPLLQVAKILNRSRQTIYNVYTALNNGISAFKYYKKYKQNKRKCGRHSISLSDNETKYIQKKVAQGLTLDVIISRAEFPISCSVRTLYKLFERKQFDSSTLPMKSKRKPNGHKEKRGKQAFKQTIHQRNPNIASFKVNLVIWKVTPLLVKITKILLLHSLNDYQK